MLSEEISRLLRMAAALRSRADAKGDDPLGLVRARTGYALDALAIESAAELALGELARQTMGGPLRLVQMKQWAAEQDPAVRANVMLLCNALEDCAFAVYAAKRRVEQMQADVARVQSLLKELEGKS